MTETGAFAVFMVLIFVFAGVLDAAWLRYIHPIMTRHFGWPPVRIENHLPFKAYLGMAAFVVAFIMLLELGAAVGY